MQTKLIFLAEDSPANPTAAQANDSVKTMSATFGQKCLEQYEKFPRVSSWAKMFAASLIGMEGWYSRRCALSWKVMGIKSRPLLYLRAGSVRHTEESGFGLLPTPLAYEKTQHNQEAFDQRMQRLIDKGYTPFTMGLHQMAIRGLLPTPNAFDWNTAQHQDKYQERKKMQMEKGINLHYSLRQMTMDINPAGTTSQLNPRFVGEMMGFPANWTELPFLSGETKV